jgi:hypothetical protein
MLYITHLWIDKRFLKKILYQTFFYVSSPFFAKVGFSVKNVLKTALFWPNWPKNIETLRLNSKMYICFSDKATAPQKLKIKNLLSKAKIL